MYQLSRYSNDQITHGGGNTIQGLMEVELEQTEEDGVKNNSHKLMGLDVK